MTETRRQQQKHFTATIPAPSKLDLQGQLETYLENVWDMAFRLNKEENSYQCAVLLACISEDALEVFEGLPSASEKEETNIDSAVCRFTCLHWRRRSRCV